MKRLQYKPREECSKIDHYNRHPSSGNVFRAARSSSESSGPLGEVAELIDDDKTTEDYKEFYGEEIVVTAEILRRSLYKKPEIKIKAISPRQTSLLGEEE